jgi:hypothetical protein
MSQDHNPSTPNSLSPIYQIRIKGHLGDHWAQRFEGMTLTLEADGHTLLVGHIVDQAALHSLLRQVRNIGLPLVAVMRVDNRLKPQTPNPTFPGEEKGLTNDSTS